MTEIIENLHQIGAHELDQLVDADIVIDMGGILNRVYAHSGPDNYKSVFNVPIVSFEIDEVDNEPFYNHRNKLNGLYSVSDIGANCIGWHKMNVYTLCLAGQNRSGLMSALILINLGYSPYNAVNLIKSKRDMALNNKQIENFILSLGTG